MRCLALAPLDWRALKTMTTSLICFSSNNDDIEFLSSSEVISERVWPKKRQQSLEDDVVLPIVAPNLDVSYVELRHETKLASGS